jgi:hypothetical protein
LFAEEEFMSITTNVYYKIRLLYYTNNFYLTATTIPIDSQFVFGCRSICPDIYRGGIPGEVYVSSWFPDDRYRVSFSTDTGRTFRHVYVSDVYPVYAETKPFFMSDREPGVFYIIKAEQVEDLNPWGHHTKLCIEYYRDYGEILEAIFCHDLTKDYEYEEIICDNTTLLEANISNNTIQLHWVNPAGNIRGYHVFRNDTRITGTLLTEPTFLDENLPIGNYEYYVRTYYEMGCVSDSSNHVAVDIELGIASTTLSNQIQVYPNPAFTSITIEAENFNKAEIYNVFGQMLHISSNKIIDVISLSSGIYFVRVYTEKGMTVKKVVKN